MNDWFEIFKAGRHTDANGNTREFTIADLDRIVESYNAEEHEAPIVIGHPKNNHPAWGWIKSLKRVGEKLLALPTQVVPEFAEMVKKGMFKKRSISLYPDLRLRHVGFLGAVPPAVKGLADIEFESDDNSLVYEFEDYRMPLVGRIFQRLRDFIIDKFDLDAADRIVAPWEIEELSQVPEPALIEENKFNEPKQKEIDMADQHLQQQLEELQMQFNELQAQLAEREETIRNLRGQVDKSKARQRRIEFERFLDGLEDGKVTPAQRPVLLDLMEVLHQAGEYEFSEGEEKVKKPAVKVFQEFIQSLPKQVITDEIATGPEVGSGKDEEDDFEFASATVDEERLELAKKARKLAKEKEISFVEAVKIAARTQ